MCLRLDEEWPEVSTRMWEVPVCLKLDEEWPEVNTRVWEVPVYVKLGEERPEDVPDEGLEFGPIAKPLYSGFGMGVGWSDSPDVIETTRVCASRASRTFTSADRCSFKDS